MNVITQDEAAKRLGVHPNTVATMLSDGRLRPVVVGSEGGPKQPRRRVDAASLPRKATERPQHMVALAKANAVYRGHAALKREVRAGTLSVAEAMEDERAQGKLTIAALLSAQKRWAATRTRRFLIPLRISENVLVDALTERQRGLIAIELRGEC